MIRELLAALSLPAVGIVGVTLLVLILNYGWRATTFALALQYTGVFILAGLSWPVEMAAAKLVAGWMACAVLGVSASEIESSGGERIGAPEYSWPSSRLFRFLASLLIIFTVLSLAPNANEWAPRITGEQSFGGLLLIGLGLLQLGFTAAPLRVAAGLLSVLSGFEVVYAAVETSALLAGLLAAVTLGIALATAYLMLAPQMEEAG